MRLWVDNTWFDCKSLELLVLDVVQVYVLKHKHLYRAHCLVTTGEELT